MREGGEAVGGSACLHPPCTPTFVQPPSQPVGVVAGGLSANQPLEHGLLSGAGGIYIYRI